MAWVKDVIVKEQVLLVPIAVKVRVLKVLHRDKLVKYRQY